MAKAGKAGGRKRLARSPEEESEEEEDGTDYAEDDSEDHDYQVGVSSLCVSTCLVFSIWCLQQEERMALIMWRMILRTTITRWGGGCLLHLRMQYIYELMQVLAWQASMAS